jgi:hypothetical protein
VSARALFVGLLVALALPGVAQAHHNPPVAFTGVLATTTPTVDGALSNGEWTDAPAYPVTFGALSGTVRFKHDAQYLYVALTVMDSGTGSKSGSFFFDDNHDGLKQPGEDVMLAFVGGGDTGGDFYYSSTGDIGGASHYGDGSGAPGTTPPANGTRDVLAGGTEGMGQVTLELRHPLCSADDAHDFCLTNGVTVGVLLQYQSGGPFWRYPGTSPFDPSDWADLTISAAPAATGRIVFESNRDGNLEIYRMNPDGGAVTRLTSNPATDNLPSISPDGTKVAFSSDRGDGTDIYVMNIDGTGVTQLTTNPADDLQPAWSPDGTKIAFTSNQDIVVMNADGTGQMNVTNTAADEGGVSWSPDGTQIAFSSTRDGNSEIYRENSDGSGTATRLTNNSAEDHDPDWSPDGTKLAFYSDRAGSVFGSVWTIDATNGANPVNLTHATIFDADPSWSPDGTRIAFVRDAGGQNFNVWTALADGTEQVNLTGIGGRNSFPDWGPIPQGATSAEISIAGPGNSDPGAVSAAIEHIPLDAIRGETGTTAGAPLAGIPLAGIPLAGIPLAGIPLAGIPLAGIGFRVEDLNQNGLGGVPLSTIPLVLPDKWETHLALDPAFAGTPPQNVTLAQVLETDVMDGVTLEELNLASSPLAGIPLAGIALGSLPLAGIPLPGTGSTNLDNWCEFVDNQPGFSCSDSSTLTDQTMLGLALEGVPLAGIPLAGIPLAGIPLAGIPLAGIFVGTPLAGIPTGGIDLMGTPLGGIPLAGIDMSVSPLAGILLGDLPDKNAILDCGGNYQCPDTDTLGDAKAAGAIKASAKLQDLGYYKDANGQYIPLGDLVMGLPDDTTLEDLLATVLLKTAYDWEALPLPAFPLQDFSLDGGTVDYTASFTVDGAGAPVDGEISVRMPSGARYVRNSTELTGGPGTVEGEPTLTQPENELTWSVSGIELGTSYELAFQAKPGLSLGTELASASLDATGLEESVDSPTPAATAIDEPGEPGNGDPETAPLIEADTLYLGYTSSGSDRDFFQVEAAAGEQLTIHLSHLNVDDDLVIYGPGIAPLRTPHPGAETPVAGDVPFDLGQRTQSITPEALTDVPQSIGGQSALDVSDNRGLADEEVSVVSPEGGTYTIQVSSFDGGYSNDPWVVRVERSSALLLPGTCTNPQGPGGGVTKPMPQVPAGASTLYLVASKRLGDLYGLQAENDVWSRLQTLAARSDAAGGAVIPVDANTAVLTALNARASDSCSPAKANAVVRAVGSLLDNIVNPSVKYIVVVGDDAAGVPFGRILDNTSYANERGYASTFYGNSNNQYLSSYGLGFLPTDDPLGDVNYSGEGPYVPELAVGRLVETPTQIISQINQYITRNGAITPTRALTTGYDFLTDGALQISARFRARFGTNNAQELISNSWTKTNLLNAMFPASNPPTIDSINGHYDHYRSLPADENAAQRESILYTTADLAGRSTTGRVIFTMGCHSALPVSDFVLGNVLKNDWAQGYAQIDAVVYMGNTGFGLGDTAAVLYSEKLNVLFASRLDGSMTVGQALAFAKQEYAATPTHSGYHLKVIDEATMMGLPMYRVGTGTTAPPPTPAVTTTDSATGLPTAAFSVNPSFTPVNTPIGRYYVSDDSFAENRRPIEPTAKVDVTQPGLVAHGALITGLTSTDEPNFDAAFSRVVDDLSGFTPELAGDVSYPTKLQSISTVLTPIGSRQRLGLFTGQFQSNATLDARGIGTQRRFTALSGNVFYTAPGATDFTPSTFGPVEATLAGNNMVGFAVDVTDDVGGASGVKRVLALYRDEGGAWQSIEMSHNSSRWSGGGPLTGDSVEWFIQAVDSSGNVAVTSNKAFIESVAPEDPVGDIAAALSGPQVNGWYTGDVEVTITGAPDISYSLDGAPFTAGDSLTISGTGVHSLDFQGSNGEHGSVAVPIDVSDPTVTVNGTYAFGSIAHASCADAGSGIASCTADPDPLDTTSAGSKTVHVHAVDRVGRSFEGDLPYTVTSYSFTGFFSPISNLPALNVANAGSTIPIKFSLAGFRGFNLFAQGYPASQAMNCTTRVLSGPIQRTTLGTQGFTYDPLLDQYKYVWQTDRRWMGTCRQLIVRFADGTEKRANFRFT